MRTEREIRDKITSLMNMLENVKKDTHSLVANQLVDELESQIDMLLWVVKDDSGLPPLDEDEMYKCYH